MSKGIVNNRDKFVWDNSHKPDISDVVSEIDGEMDDLLEDHDDKIVDIVGDNMNDLLDAHDDKVVSIVGDNMSTLLTSNASTVQLIAGDKSGITSTPSKVGTWDSTHDIYAVHVTGDVGEVTVASNVLVFQGSSGNPIFAEGYITAGGVDGHICPINTYVSSTEYVGLFWTPTTNYYLLKVPAYFSEGTYDVIIYYLVSTATP